MENQNIFNRDDWTYQSLQLRIGQKTIMAYFEDGIWYGPDLNYDYEGHLAGSHLTLDNACRNLMTHTGYGLCHAIRCATINPARLLGFDDEVGSLERGKKANLILIDDMVHVKQVILQGEPVI